MASLNNIYFKLETLETLVATLKKKREKGISIDFAINDESNDYSQNISAYVSQSKEDREAKKPRFYVGNGKCFWTDGKIEVAKKTEKIQVHEAEVVIPTDENDDLPF